MNGLAASAGPSPFQDTGLRGLLRVTVPKGLPQLVQHGKERLALLGVERRQRLP
jgi:hypothetical protein